MALSSSSINKGRGKTQDIRNSLSNLTAELTSFKDKMKANENYNKYVESTNNGKKANDNLFNIINYLDQDITSNTSKILDKLSRYFDYQEELNTKNLL